jgi:hypothetical protein
VRSEGQAGGLSWLLGMWMALLGGCWYPAELFPQAVRTASQVLPTTWAMLGMLAIVVRGQGWPASCCRPWFCWGWPRSSSPLASGVSGSSNELEMGLAVRHMTTEMTFGTVLNDRIPI